MNKYNVSCLGGSITTAVTLGYEDNIWTQENSAKISNQIA